MEECELCYRHPAFTWCNLIYSAISKILDCKFKDAFSKNCQEHLSGGIKFLSNAITDSIIGKYSAASGIAVVSGTMRHLCQMSLQLENLMRHESYKIWDHSDNNFQLISKMGIDVFSIEHPTAEQYADYLAVQHTRYASWLENQDLEIAMNSIHFIIGILAAMQRKSHQDLAQRSQKRNQSFDKPSKEPKICPKCGKRMIIKKAQSGGFAGKEFWGCEGYPDCKCIIDIDEAGIQKE